MNQLDITFGSAPERGYILKLHENGMEDEVYCDITGDDIRYRYFQNIPCEDPSFLTEELHWGRILNRFDTGNLFRIESWGVLDLGRDFLFNCEKSRLKKGGKSPWIRKRICLYERGKIPDRDKSYFYISIRGHCLELRCIFQDEREEIRTERIFSWDMFTRNISRDVKLNPFTGLKLNRRGQIKLWT